MITPLYARTELVDEFVIEVGGKDLRFIPGLEIELTQFASPTQIKESKALQSRVLAGDVILRDTEDDVTVAQAFDQIFGEERFVARDDSHWVVTSLNDVPRISLTPTDSLVGWYTLEWSALCCVSTSYRAPILTLTNDSGDVLDLIKPLYSRANRPLPLSRSQDLYFEGQQPTITLNVRGDRLDYSIRICKVQIALKRQTHG